MAQGDQINIQAELVDTATESQLWGEQFRQKITDLMAVQQEIAWQISEALRLKLSNAQRDALVRVVERRFRAKDIIFTPGDPDDQLYFLLEGTVRLY